VGTVYRELIDGGMPARKCSFSWYLYAHCFKPGPLLPCAGCLAAKELKRASCMIVIPLRGLHVEYT
jgi:hypothetical protein